MPVINVPGFRATDSNGDPISGAKAKAYLIGTLTPTILYAESTLVTPLSWPVIADASGLFPAMYTSLTSMRVILTDASDVEIADVDPYSSGGLILAANSYTIPEAGGVARNLLDKLQDLVTFEDFGAVGDGATNDTAAVAAAMATGRSILVRDKTYLADTVVFSTAGQKLIGENRATSRLKLRSDPVGNFVELGAHNDCGLYDLTVDGADIVHTILGNALVGFTGDRVRVERCIVRGGDRLNIAARDCDDVVIRDNDITAKQIIGVRISGSITAGSGGTNGTGYSAVITGGTAIKPATATYNVVAGSVANFAWVDHGQYNPAGGTPTISFPAVANASATLIKAGSVSFSVLMTGTGAVMDGWEISGNRIENAGVYVRGVNCRVFNNDVSKVIYGAAIVEDANVAVGRNDIHDNILHDSGVITQTAALAGPDTDSTVTHGIESWSNGSSIHDNKIYNFPDVGIVWLGRSVEIYDNECFNNGAWWASLGTYTNSAGITLLYFSASYPAANGSVRGNKCYDTLGAAGVQGYGIVVGSSSVTGASIEGNDCEGNRIQAYKLNGAQLSTWRGRQLMNSMTWDPGSIAAGGKQSQAVTVGGLDVGARWMLSAFHAGSSNLNVTCKAYGSATDQATVDLWNNTAGAIDPPSGVLMVTADELSTYFN